MNKRRNNVKRGFTLIEILIVVVILGILAAIIVPQFTDAAQDANESSARSQLQTIRSQIELHRVQNNGAAPADMAELVADGYIRAVPSGPRASPRPMPPEISPCSTTAPSTSMVTAATTPVRPVGDSRSLRENRSVVPVEGPGRRFSISTGGSRSSRGGRA
jgi:prepilin-type N-terminal cleavage/methylation domain-containing protein